MSTLLIKNALHLCHSLITDPEYSDVVAKLQECIIEHNEVVNAPAAEWLREIRQGDLV